MGRKAAIGVGLLVFAAGLAVYLAVTKQLLPQLLVAILTFMATIYGTFVVGNAAVTRKALSNNGHGTVQAAGGMAPGVPV